MSLVKKSLQKPFYRKKGTLLLSGVKVKVSKKISLSLSVVLIAVIATAFVTLFFNNQVSDLQNQNRNLQIRNSYFQNQTSKLEDQNNILAKQLVDLQDEIKTIKINITKFEMVSVFNPVVGLLIADRVRVTVQNVGANISGDAAEITLTVIMMSNSTTQLYGSWGFSKQVVTFHTGENQEIEGYVYYDLGTYGTYVSTLTLGDFILDKWEGTHRVAW